MCKICACFNRFFAAIGRWLQSPLLLLLRLFFGISLIFTGLNKLQDIPAFTDQLIALNIPYPQMAAWAAGLGEFIGGALLAVGLLSRFAALVIAFIMGVAYSTVHVDSVNNLFVSPAQFVGEHPFGFLLTALLVFAFGPGFFSLDALCRKNCKETESEKK